jgi:antitoxin component YwqK of YwqJK toxin-antitoxin module
MANIIPPAAHEVIHDTWETGAPKAAYYYVDGQSVGFRTWSESGQLEMEYAIMNGLMHGRFRTWHENGQLREEATYEAGKEHGQSRQYNEAGVLLGSYTLEHGTGTDLWFSDEHVLAEERQYKDGLRHGYERWWNTDNRTVSQEAHYWQGDAHGIVRHWNAQGKLRRGYPRYFVAGQQVTKRHYVRACRTNPTLPLYNSVDNTPFRQLPDAIQMQRMEP